MIKASLGKLVFDADPLDCAERLGFELLHFSAKDAVKLKDLPYHHRDPFDRMLIAQCLTQPLALMTNDHRLREYGCDFV